MRWTTVLGGFAHYGESLMQFAAGVLSAALPKGVLCDCIAALIRGLAWLSSASNLASLRATHLCTCRRLPFYVMQCPRSLWHATREKNERDRN
jgi:hypothetical protein